MNSQTTCKIRRLTVPGSLLGHEAYEKQAVKIAELIETLTKDKDVLLEESAASIRYKMAVVAYHLVSLLGKEPCADCRRGVLSPCEARFAAACEQYRASAHNRTAASLFEISISLPISDASSGEEKYLFPLSAIIELLEEKTSPL